MSEEPRTHESPYGDSIANGMTEKGLLQSRGQEIDYRRGLSRRRKWLKAQLGYVEPQINLSRARTEIYQLVLDEMQNRKGEKA